MKRWLKILSVALLLLVVGWIGYQVANRPAPPASGPIVLPDGSWAYIEAVTYGTNHLVGPPLSHVAWRLPQAMRSMMVRFIGRPASMRFTHTTRSPKLVLWLNRGMANTFPPSQGYFECVLSDTNGFTSGEKVHFAARYPLTVTEFTVFPRRSPEITLSIYYHDATGAVFKRGSVAFANPLYRRYPEWKPESLPSTKRAGDVEVTLEQVHTGLNWNYDRETSLTGHALVFTPNRLDGASATVCALRLRPTVNTNEIWRVASVTTSDATGNRVTNASLSADETAGYVEFSPALWGSEPAWKLNFELARVAGFGTNEQFTFANVPLGAFNSTNRLEQTANCGGIPITLVQTAWRESPPTPNRLWPSADFELRLGLMGHTNDLRVDLVSARTDAGTELVPLSQSETETNRSYLFGSPPPEAKSMNVTFAIQRSRWVEFLVKPETGTMQLKIRPGGGRYE